MQSIYCYSANIYGRLFTDASNQSAISLLSCSVSWDLKNWSKPFLHWMDMGLAGADLFHENGWFLNETPPYVLNIFHAIGIQNVQCGIFNFLKHWIVRISGK